MAIFRPFQAFRPTPENQKSIPALPYDVMSSDEARELVKGNVLSFLHVDKAEVDLDPGIDLYDARVYAKAKENLQRLEKSGVMVQDATPCFYIYQQVMNGRCQTGIAGCAGIDDYTSNVIKKHELTRADKEADRIRHVDTCDANTGPIFLTYRNHPKINQIVESYMGTYTPVYDFVTEDGVTNTVWVIEDKKICDEISQIFSGIESLYIADGHHRCASAVKVGMKRREQMKKYTGNEEFNFFLCVAFPDEQLKIMDYNRVVADLNGLSRDQFLKRVYVKFDIQRMGRQPQKPVKNHTFGMFLENEWYLLTAKEGTFDEKDPVARLDVSILQQNLLAPVLGIGDPRVDKRIDFVGGIRGVGELEKRVRNGAAVAFSMYPTTVEELMDIADADKIMPPKSTWFEPKLLSGLFIHHLD